jgi:multicomponent Na+:H+ antiporter subunit B
MTVKSKTKTRQKDKQCQEQDIGMSIIVKTITRLTVGILFLYGVNVTLHGHIAPGGGFAGGAIIALALLNLVLAFGQDAALEKLSYIRAIVYSTSGLIVFLLLGLFTDIWDVLFFNFKEIKNFIIGIFDVGIIPFLNLAVCFQVGAGVFVIFICLMSINKEAEGQE